MGVSTIRINNISVILVDCANKTASEKDEIITTLKTASTQVASNHEKSVYIITDVTNVRFNSDISTAFREYASANTKYIKESILVGLSGMQLIAFNAIKALTKREYHLSPTLEDAKMYIASL